MYMCVYTCVCVCVYAVVIDEAQQAEALLMLNTILQFESRATSDVTADDAAAAADGDGDVEMECSEGVARVTHSLAMLHYLLHDSHQALHALLLYTVSYWLLYFMLRLVSRHPVSYSVWCRPVEWFWRIYVAVAGSLM